MLPDYVYFVASATLVLLAVPALATANGRRRVLAALPALGFLCLLVLAAEIAFRIGRAHGGGGGAASTPYTCSMHPQVRHDGPGLCPICHMDLVPLGSGAEIGSSAHEVHIDPVVVQIMGVRIATAVRAPLRRTVRAFGELRVAENRRRDVALKLDGYVEQLFADTEGMAIARGTPLFAIYAPELVVAQAELIAARIAGDSQLLAAARQKLMLWDLDRAEIDRLQALAEPERAVRWLAPIDGVLLQKNVTIGAPARAGDVLLRLADLGVLWLDVQVPASHLASIAVGATATAELRESPDLGIVGKVVFVAPEVDRTLRTGTVRVEAGFGSLRPGMFATARIELPPGDDAVQVPAEAVLDTGGRQLAWLAVGKGRFAPRLVTTGRRGDDGNVEILTGLQAGDVVVTSGQFLIDAESRLREGARKFGDDDTMPGGDLPPPPPLALAAATQQRVDALLLAYRAVADALSHDRADAEAWQHLQGAVDSLLTAGEPEVVAAAGAIAAAMQPRASDLEAMRVRFKGVSAAALHLFERARPHGDDGAKALFVQHCPMAEADWLQLEARTKNPYYGSSMLECGAVRRELPLAGGR